MKALLIAALALSVFASTAEEDRVAQFPGFPAGYTFATYSGYLEIPNTKRALHYVLLESQSDPSKDPVVLWLNGGPGCSSLLGMITEVGAFVQPDGSEDFVANPYSWNRKANLLFLESPPGVGFSYSDELLYTHSDPNTASDNYQALLTFFRKFPQFKGRDFFISGESYAGMYIPFTATAIVAGNKASAEKINLQGVLIGNGAMIMDNTFRTQVTQKYYVTRNFVAPETADVLTTTCVTKPLSLACLTAQRQYQAQISGINPYNVYGYCFGDSSSEMTGEPMPYTPWAAQATLNALGAPCTDFGPAQRFFNNKDVQAKLHVRSTNWQACSTVVGATYQRAKQSIDLLVPLHKNGVRVLVYSGDNDAVISTTDTIESLKKLNLTEKKSFYPWGTSDSMLGGYKVDYEELSLVIVRGAGHMVPQDQREFAFTMFDNFVNQKEFREVTQ